MDAQGHLPKAVHLEDAGEFTVILVRGSFDHQDRNDLKQKTREIIQSGRRCFVIDLGQSSRDFDPTVVNLITVLTQILENGGIFCLRNGRWFMEWMHKNLIGGPIYTECNDNASARAYFKAAYRKN